jgi:serine/threonine-protein kinase
MRTCPACKSIYADDETVCSKDGTLLVHVDALSFSETMRSTAAGGLAGVAASSTPGPVVRANMSFPEVSAEFPRTGNDSLVGSTLSDRYEVTRKIGEGGMGAVYEGRHKLIGKRVAIKVLLDKFAQKADVVARLQQEARLASSIGHEHIVDITDFGETRDGRTFVVMEYLEGESVAALLSREGPLPPDRAVTIGRQVASALGAAHEKGIVHRDIKPENIFLIRRSDRDFVKVVDFGISKALRLKDEEDSPSSPRLTQTGMVLGTPLYMSPEQARGEDDLDHRIDVYALGIILYELITGEVPYRGTNYLNIIAQVLSQEAKPPSRVRPDLGITPALEAVILKAMAKDRDLRYAGMRELDEDLAKIQGGGEIVMVQGGPALATVRTEESPAARRKALLLWIAGVSVVVIGTGAAIVPLLGTKDRPEPPAQVAAAPAPVPKAAEPPPAPRVDLITVNVTSLPSGAEVWWKSRNMGTTPNDIELPRGDDQIGLVLRLAGYVDAEALFYPSGNQNVSVTLVKLKPGKKPRPPAGIKNPFPSPLPPPPTKDPGPTGGGEIKGNPFHQ